MFFIIVQNFVRFFDGMSRPVPVGVMCRTKHIVVKNFHEELWSGLVKISDRNETNRETTSQFN